MAHFILARELRVGHISMDWSHLISRPVVALVVPLVRLFPVDENSSAAACRSVYIGLYR